MKILITNDDGIEAQGIKVLVDSLKDEHDLLVLAPYKEQSGVSSHLTVRGDMQIKRRYIFDGVRAYSLQGTPADCISVFFDNQEDFNFIPDLIIAGINRGSNMAYDLIFSGTCGAARQGALWGYNSIALSSCGYQNPNYETAARFLIDNFDIFFSLADKRSFWNVNVPDIEYKDLKGYKYCKLGVLKYNKNYSKTTENKYVLTGYGEPDLNNSKDSDVEAVNDNYVAITPITIDQTNYELLKDIK